jgi:hypothetical protein
VITVVVAAAAISDDFGVKSGASTTAHETSGSMTGVGGNDGFQK